MYTLLQVPVCVMQDDNVRKQGGNVCISFFIDFIIKMLPSQLHYVINPNGQPLHVCILQCES